MASQSRAARAPRYHAAPDTWFTVRSARRHGGEVLGERVVRLIGAHPRWNTTAQTWQYLVEDIGGLRFPVLEAELHGPTPLPTVLVEVPPAPSRKVKSSSAGPEPVPLEAARVADFTVQALAWFCRMTPEDHPLHEAIISHHRGMTGGLTVHLEAPRGTIWKLTVEPVPVIYGGAGTPGDTTSE